MIRIRVLLITFYLWIFEGFTKTKMDALQLQIDKLQMTQSNLETTNEKELWKQELNKFKQEYLVWEKKMKSSK